MSQYPIFPVTGSRQSGNTALLREYFSDYIHVSLENPDIIKFANNTPNKFPAQYNN